MSDTHADTVTALLLAGGQASRMNGNDKGLLDCGGQTLIARTLAGIAQHVNTVLISANRNLDRYRGYGYPVLGDAEADYPGPLAGILRGLQQCATAWLWIVPCDAPQVDAQLLTRLLDACRTTQLNAAVPIENGFAQPTFALLHTETLTAVRAYWDKGGRSVQECLATLPAARVECSDHPKWFVNLNTPEELAEYATRLQGVHL